MQQNHKLYKPIQLFLVFLKIGAFTFGGGFAMIPFIQREIVEKNKWIDEEDIIDIFAIVQSVPGVIAVNSSIFVGYRVAGIWGALAATLGVVLPSFIIISIIALFLYDYKNMPFVNEAFLGIRAGVTALILYVVFKLGKKSIQNIFGWSVAVIAFISVVFLDINAILILLLAGISGLLRSLWIKYTDARRGNIK